MTALLRRIYLIAAACFLLLGSLFCPGLSLEASAQQPAPTASPSPTGTLTPTATLTPGPSSATPTATPTRQPTFTVTATPPNYNSPDWSTPIEFPINGWFPDLVADPTGRLHLVWSHSEYPPSEDVTSDRPTSGYDVVYYTTSLDGVRWTPINDILAVDQTAVYAVTVTRPDLLVDPKGKLHSSLRDAYNLYYTQTSIQSVADARSWLSPFQMTWQNDVYFTALALDRRGWIHYFFTQNVPEEDCRSCFHLFHRRSTNDGMDWANRTDISLLSTGSAKPQVLVDSMDTLHVMWESGPGGALGGVNTPVQIMYTNSTDGGETWSTPLAFTDPEIANARNPVIAEDGNGILVAAWHNLAEDKVYYVISPDKGKSWSQPQGLAGVWGEEFVRRTRQTGYTMATDSAGQVHLILPGRWEERQTSLSLLHLVWDGQAWSEPQVVITYQDGLPEWPKLVVSNGNQLNLVWFKRPTEHIWDADPNTYNVWYAQSVAEAPHIAPLTWESLLPTPTASLDAALENQGLSLSTATPTQPGLDFSGMPVPDTRFLVTSEMDDLGIVALGLLPTGLILVVLVLVKSLRQRRR